MSLMKTIAMRLL